MVLARELSANDWEQLKHVRLRQIEETSGRDAKAYQDTFSNTEAFWQEQAEGKLTDDGRLRKYFGVFEHGTLVGIGMTIPHRLKPEAKIYLASAYVLPTYRQQGLHDLLMAVRVEAIYKNDPAKMVVTGFHNSEQRGWNLMRKWNFHIQTRQENGYVDYGKSASAALVEIRRIFGGLVTNREITTLQQAPKNYPHGLAGINP